MGLRYTIEIDGWETLKLLGPIAHWLTVLDEIRERGEIDTSDDDIDLLVATDEAGDAIGMLLANFYYCLKIAQSCDQDILLNSSWEDILQQLPEILEKMQKLFGKEAQP